MKKILVIPKDTTGIIDVRKNDYMILDKKNTVEEIVAEVSKSSRIPMMYKFCQFEENAVIPVALKVKDRISSGPMTEFESERVTFSDAKLDDVEEIVKERFLNSLVQEKDQVINKTLILSAEEKLGVKITDEDYKELKSEYGKINKSINSFDYKKHLKELV